MIVTSNILANISQNLEPAAEDTKLLIPPVGVIPIFARLPLRALDAAPGSATQGAAFSFSVFLDILINASTAAGTANAGFLAPGLWELSCSMCGKNTIATTPATMTQEGLAFIQPPAILASTWAQFRSAEGYSDQISHGPVIFELDTITQIVYRTPATGVGEAARIFVGLQCSRLL